jgi:elongation factor P
MELEWMSYEFYIKKIIKPDLTRTIGENIIDEEKKRIYNLVFDAQKAKIDSVKPRIVKFSLLLQRPIMKTKTITPNQFSRGFYVLFNNEIFIVVDFQHVKMGRGGAHMNVKLKNFLTGKVLEYTLRPDEKIEQVILGEKEVTFLYSANDVFYFLDKSGNEISLPLKKVGNQKMFLKEGDTVAITESGGKLVSLKLPLSVKLKVIRTDPGVKGDTVSGGSKPAELETGLTINVPLFVKEGDIVKVDTRKCEYLERV